jgi:hypothetical protein
MSNFDDEIGITPAVVDPVAPTIEPETSTSTATDAAPTTSAPPAPTAAPLPPYDPTADKNDSPQTAANHRSSRGTKGVPPARYTPGTAAMVFRRDGRHS